MSNLNFWEGSVSSGDTPGHFPYIAHNGTNSTQTYDGYLVYPAGQLGLHPGPDGEYSHIRFTAPQAMTINISGSFFKIDPNATTDVHILDNAVSIFGAEIGPASSDAFSLTRSVITGETIDFAVGDGTDGTFNSDSTGLSADLQVQGVPEPRNFVLFGSGIALLLLFARRCKAVCNLV